MENAPEFGKVEGTGGIFTIRGGDNVRGWNGIRYKSGVIGKECIGEKAIDECGYHSAWRSGVRGYPCGF
jgi:hypothetical protein